MSKAKVAHLYARSLGSPPPLGAEASCGHLRDDERELAKGYTVCGACVAAHTAETNGIIAFLDGRVREFYRGFYRAVTE